jgi:hypothetical protein
MGPRYLRPCARTPAAVAVGYERSCRGGGAWLACFAASSRRAGARLRSARQRDCGRWRTGGSGGGWKSRVGRRLGSTADPPSVQFRRDGGERVLAPRQPSGIPAGRGWDTGGQPSGIPAGRGWDTGGQPERHPRGAAMGHAWYASSASKLRGAKCPKCGPSGLLRQLRGAKCPKCGPFGLLRQAERCEMSEMRTFWPAQAAERPKMSGTRRQLILIRRSASKREVVCFRGVAEGRF